MQAVYFVLPEREQRRIPFIGDIQRENITFADYASMLISDQSCWILQTWAILREQPFCPFEPRLISRALPGEVCVFHYDSATLSNHVHNCLSVVVQADRPEPPLVELKRLGPRLTDWK
jgi:hypothetical protein